MVLDVIHAEEAAALSLVCRQLIIKKDCYVPLRDIESSRYGEMIKVVNERSKEVALRYSGLVLRGVLLQARSRCV